MHTSNFYLKRTTCFSIILFVGLCLRILYFHFDLDASFALVSFKHSFSLSMTHGRWIVARVARLVSAVRTYACSHISQCQQPL